LSCTVNYDEERECIFVTVEGELNLPLLEKIAAEVGKIEREHGCKRVLNNLLDAKMTQGALEVYKMKGC